MAVKKLHEIFIREEVLQSIPSAWNNDFHFSPTHHLGLEGCRVIREELRLVENPLYLVRKYYVAAGSEDDTPVQITLALAWDGAEPALDFLLGFCEALDLFFNPEKLIDTRVHSIGDFGVAWGWVSGEINVLAFIRRNVFVGIQGFLSSENMLAAARAIDGVIQKAGIVDRYADEGQGFFARSLEQASRARLSPGERMDIGIQAPGLETFFFQTCSGSMNRDPHNPYLWYYRVGKELGSQKITLFRVGEGMLPKRETLQVEVTGEVENVAQAI